MDVYQIVEHFYRSYGGKKRVIGKSVLGRELFAFYVGKERGVQGICQYAIHGREWITALLALEQIRYGVAEGGVWFCPLVDPDGALLSQKGIASVKNARIAERLLAINGGKDFSLWKANAVGVDLNVNFDAGWGRGEKNVFFPASENYVGKFPFSEPETRALKDLTLAVKPQFTVSYHTAGEEIYWYYRQNALRAARDKKLAEIIKRSTGYPLRYATGSHGGYKDWCIAKRKIPSFTVEVGKGKHPLKENALFGIVEKNLRSVRDLTDEWNSVVKE